MDSAARLDCHRGSAHTLRPMPTMNLTGLHLHLNRCLQVPQLSSHHLFSLPLDWEAA